MNEGGIEGNDCNKRNTKGNSKICKTRAIDDTAQTVVHTFPYSKETKREMARSRQSANRRRGLRLSFVRRSHSHAENSENIRFRFDSRDSLTFVGLLIAQRAASFVSSDVFGESDLIE